MTTRINTRSTAAINEFIDADDRIATIEEELKELKALRAKLEPIVREQIGEQRTVKRGNRHRILRPVVRESISAACDDQETCEVLTAFGLGEHVRSRSPIHCPTQTLKKLRRQGILPDGLVKVRETIEIEVTA